MTQLEKDNLALRRLRVFTLFTYLALTAGAVGYWLQTREPIALFAIAYLAISVAETALQVFWPQRDWRGGAVLQMGIALFGVFVVLNVSMLVSAAAALAITVVAFIVFERQYRRARARRAN